MKVAIYVRVSTAGQEDGYSLDEQIDKLKKFCDIKEWSVYDVYKDGGYSGSNIDRPAISRLIKDVKHNRVDCVLVYKLDRLSRSQKDTLYLIEDVFIKNKVAFVSINENFDTTTAFGKAMIGILSVFAQLEREQIKERMQLGKLGRIKSGKPSAWTNSPFGYDYVDGELVINEPQAVLVRYIYNEYLKGISVTKLVDKLNDAGHKSKKVKWSYRTVRIVLCNPVYIGKTPYKGELYDGSHSPIVDIGIYEQTQQQLQLRQKDAYEKFNPRPFQAKYMLSGLVFCKHCGCRFSVILGTKRKDGSRSRRYKCYSTFSNKKFTNKRKDSCIAKNIDMLIAEDVVLNEIEKLRLDPTLIVDEVGTHDTEYMDAIERNISAIDVQLDKLVDLYLDGSFSRDKLDTRQRELTEQRAKFVKELDGIEIKKADLSTDGAKQILKDLSSIHELDYDTQKIIVNKLVKKVVLTVDTAEIHWRFKL